MEIDGKYFKQCMDQAWHAWPRHGLCTVHAWSQTYYISMPGTCHGPGMACMAHAWAVHGHKNITFPCLVKSWVQHVLHGPCTKPKNNKQAKKYKISLTGQCAWSMPGAKL